ncbi:hypothetical protein V6N12_044939 [Hibiscus sabdariffa]|uniref:Uncharacterized protein n=1 Tax=Hibiscus sabdariffa TaxID=183260 RepID=A0ABR2G1E1_9ROSI
MVPRYEGYPLMDVHLGSLERNALETVLQAIDLTKEGKVLSDTPLNTYKTNSHSLTAEKQVNHGITTSSKQSSGTTLLASVPKTIVSKDKSKKMILASTAKLNQVATSDARQPRVASLGVTTLLHEIKTKKKEHTAKTLEVPATASRGTKSKSPQ